MHSKLLLNFQVKMGIYLRGGGWYKNFSTFLCCLEAELRVLRFRASTLIPMHACTNKILSQGSQVLQLRKRGCLYFIRPSHSYRSLFVYKSTTIIVLFQLCILKYYTLTLTEDIIERKVGLKLCGFNGIGSGLMWWYAFSAKIYLFCLPFFLLVTNAVDNNTIYILSCHCFQRVPKYYHSWGTASC